VDLARVSLIGLGMTPPQPFNTLGINFDLGLAQQLLGEQASLMPILRRMRQTESSMPSASSGNLPGENLLIDAVSPACRPGRTERPGFLCAFVKYPQGLAFARQAHHPRSLLRGQMEQLVWTIGDATDSR
jgi:hypothetical protein